jgi:hypothetical protein
VVEWFLVPATAEPLISCGIAGSTEFRERQELEIVQVHVAVEPFLAALKAVYGLTSLKTGSYFPYRNLVDLLTRPGLFRVL